MFLQGDRVNSTWSKIWEIKVELEIKIYVAYEVSVCGMTFFTWIIAETRSLKSFNRISYWFMMRTCWCTLTLSDRPPWCEYLILTT